MQKSQRPHIIAEHQWYEKENDTNKKTTTKKLIVMAGAIIKDGNR